jgi:8-oxo-dGTP pyrophosphatase MutT (NUDIX family)
MSKCTMIRLKTGKQLFNFRIAGLAFRDNHVLVHRATHEKFWTFPGGRAEIGETSVETLVREMQEELQVEAKVDRLLWSVENFFHFERRRWHEIGYYYLMTLPETFPFRSGELIHEIEDGGSMIEFKWVPATQQGLAELPLQPDFIPARIAALPASPEHLIHIEDVPE